MKRMKVVMAILCLVMVFGSSSSSSPNMRRSSSSSSGKDLQDQDLDLDLLMHPFSPPGSPVAARGHHRTEQDVKDVFRMNVTPPGSSSTTTTAATGSATGSTAGGTTMGQQVPSFYGDPSDVAAAMGGPETLATGGGGGGGGCGVAGPKDPRLAACAQRTIGVLYSGGGVRALALSTAALGIMKKFSFFERVAMIGAVSGGGWGLAAQMSADYDVETVKTRMFDSCLHQRPHQFGMRGFRISHEFSFGNTYPATHKPCYKPALHNHVNDPPCKTWRDMLKNKCNPEVFSNTFETCDTFRAPWRSLCSSEEECHTLWTHVTYDLYQRLLKPLVCPVVNKDAVSASCWYGWKQQLIDKANVCTTPVPVFSANVWKSSAQHVFFSNANGHSSGAPLVFNYGGFEKYREQPPNVDRTTGATALYNGASTTYCMKDVDEKYSNMKAKVVLMHMLSYMSSAWAQVSLTVNGFSPRTLLVNNGKDELKIADSGAYSNLAFHSLIKFAGRLKTVFAFDFGDSSGDLAELKLSLRFHFGIAFDELPPTVAKRECVRKADVTVAVVQAIDAGQTVAVQSANCDAAAATVAFVRVNVPALIGWAKTREARSALQIVFGVATELVYFPMTGVFLDSTVGQSDVKTVTVAYLAPYFPTVGGNPTGGTGSASPNYFKCSSYHAGLGNNDAGRLSMRGLFEMIQASERFYTLAMTLYTATSASTGASPRHTNQQQHHHHHHPGDRRLQPLAAAAAAAPEMEVKSGTIGGMEIL